MNRKSNAEYGDKSLTPRVSQMVVVGIIMSVLLIRFGINYIIGRKKWRKKVGEKFRPVNFASPEGISMAEMAILGCDDVGLERTRRAMVATILDLIQKNKIALVPGKREAQIKIGKTKEGDFTEVEEMILKSYLETPALLETETYKVKLPKVLDFSRKDVGKKENYVKSVWGRISQRIERFLNESPADGWYGQAFKLIMTVLAIIYLLVTVGNEVIKAGMVAVALASVVCLVVGIFVVMIEVRRARIERGEDPKKRGIDELVSDNLEKKMVIKWNSASGVDADTIAKAAVIGDSDNLELSIMVNVVTVMVVVGFILLGSLDGGVFVMLVGFIVMNGFFMGAIRRVRTTEYGERMREYLHGFQEFLESQKERLGFEFEEEWQKATKEGRTVKIENELVVSAVALGVEDDVTGKFMV